MHLDEKIGLALQIGARRIDMGAREPPFVDLLLEIEIGIGLHTTGRAQRSDAAGKIESRRGIGHLGHRQRRVGSAFIGQVGPCDIEQMVVHADQPGQHAMTGKVEHVRALRQRCRRRLDGCDPATFDDQRAIILGRRAGSVDHPHMGERDHARRHRDKGSYVFTRLRGGRQDARFEACGRRGGSQQKRCGQGNESAHQAFLPSGCGARSDPSMSMVAGPHVFVRQVAPSRTGPCHPHHAFEAGPVVAR